MSEATKFPTIEDVIAHYRSLDQRRRRQDLAGFLAHFAPTNPFTGSDLGGELTAQVMVELHHAVQQLSDLTLDLLYAALLRASHNDRRLRDKCLELVHDLRKRNPKPRNRQRDAEIVRLRDKQGMSFGQIAKYLPTLNKAWVGKSGKPHAREAIERAYYRVKGSPQH